MSWVKFKSFMITNEHPERISFYLVRQFDGEPSKIGLIFTKQSFSDWSKKYMLLMKVALLI